MNLWFIFYVIINTAIFYFFWTIKNLSIAKEIQDSFFIDVSNNLFKLKCKIKMDTLVSKDT